MQAIKILLNVWAILSLVIGFITVLVAAPIWGLFPLLCAIACSYSASLIDEILE